MIRFKKVRYKKPLIQKKKKSKAGQDALDKLNSFLDKESPEPAYFLTRMWDDQQKAITYKELKAAIRNGYMDLDTLEAWQQDYSNYVNNYLLEPYYKAMEAAAGDLSMIGSAFRYDPMWQGSVDWIETRTARLVTNCTREQQDAISALVSRAFNSGKSPDELSRAIRPCIGLTKQQAIANANYYEHVKNSLLKNNPNMAEVTAAKKAQEAAASYAAKQHRYRAQVIAETELAQAYNEGEYQAIKQAQAQGLLGTCVKVWSTAADELVCPTCGGLEGTVIDIDDRFEVELGRRVSFALVPPAHPSCRCAYEVREVDASTRHALIEPQEMAQTATPTKYDHVTEVSKEYDYNATPGVGNIEMEPLYKPEEHKDEINMANWIRNTYGGDITLLTETGKEKISDYEWNGKRWDLKTTSTEISANSAVRSGLKQIRKNPGGIILDYGKHEIVLDKVLDVVVERMKWTNLSPVDIMVVSDDKTAAIWRFIK